LDTYLHLNPHADFSEADLKVLLTQGDRRAITYLYNKYSPALYGQICKHVKDENLAGEMLKKVFVAMLNQTSSLAFSKLSLFNWMFRITHQIVLADMCETHPHQDLATELVA
jgi:RNA polymerase sigma-70 factor (ECF subfamily)